MKRNMKKIKSSGLSICDYCGNLFYQEEVMKIKDKDGTKFCCVNCLFSSVKNGIIKLAQIEQKLLEYNPSNRRHSITEMNKNV